ncbi:MAG: Calx-beta domain-containing protein [Dongiaceae bacterium]
MRGVIIEAAGGVILPNGSADVVPPVLWAIAGATQITEEAANAIYTISYSGAALGEGVTATISVATGNSGMSWPNATASADYTALATTLTFTASGATSKTVAVSIMEDTIVEGTEDFAVTLADPSTGVLGSSQVNTLIVDDDTSSLVWSIEGATETDEGDPASYTVSYTGVTLAPGQTATITVASADGTADAASDYTSLSTALTFTGGGATQKTVAVSTIDDTDIEGTEDFLVSLAGQSIGTVDDASVTTEIVDNDAPPTLLLDAISGTAVQAYSLRKLRTAYAGNCIRIRRSSDDAESDFGFDGNDLDTAAIATWLSGATGFVTTWYDQSANTLDAMQAGATDQPVYGASLVNSRPALDFVSNDFMTMTKPTASATWNTFVVAQKDNANTANFIVDNTQNRQHRINSNGTLEFYAGASFTAAHGAVVTDRHLYEWSKTGANAGEMWVDGGSIGAGDPGTGTLACDMIGKLGGAQHLDGKMAEIIVFNPHLSSGDRVTVENDISAYWGTP